MYFSDQPILKDFDKFLTYLCDRPKLPVTNDKGVLKGPDLIALNDQMTSFTSTMVTNKHPQMSFTLLNTFFFIGQTAEFFQVRKNAKNSKNELFVREDRIRAYDAMTDDEKYFSLLDTFWCFVDWDSAYDCRSFFSHEFYTKVGKKTPNKKITVSDRDLNRKGEVEAPSDYFVAELFSAFGFLELTWDENLQKRPTRYVFPYKDITMSQLGCTILPVLMKERKQFLWNRSEDAYDYAFLHSEDDDEDDDKRKGNFEDVFLPFFKGLTIKNRLLPITRTFVGGRYHLKVALGKKLYRVLALGGNDTFYDLHGAIQDAFDFGDDHLYAFYMSGKRNQGSEVFWSPYYEDGEVSAEDVKIGEVGLYEGKNFLYYFDFGASWEFSVTVEAINPDEPEPKTIEIIETVGENPEQYESWDGEDDY